MNRLHAETLDLSRLSAPLAIRGFDYETIIAERGARLVVLMNEFGIPFDVEQLKTDPAMRVERADGFREMLVIAEINDAVRAVMVAFAVDSDLDHLAAFYGVSRRLIGYERTGNKAPIYEGDEEFRRRVLLAPEAFAAAGPRGAYIYHALTSDARVLNVDVWSPVAGHVLVAVQSREGDGTAAGDLIATVRAYLYQDQIKPLTDVVTVRSIVNHRFSIDLDYYVQPGPDPALVKSEADASIHAMAAARRTPARDMPRSAIIAAAHIGAVDKVTLRSPLNDMARDYGEVAVLETLTTRVLTHDG